MRVKILADSINPNSDRITTFLIDIPKPLLGEVARHRVFSLNAASSRAIPIDRVIEQVTDDPWIPIFTKSQRGMGGKEFTDEEEISHIQAEWLVARDNAVTQAVYLKEMDVAKEIVNRLIEPWQIVPVIITGTTFDNFFNLRCAESAQADLRIIAEEMRKQYGESEPKRVEWGDYHIPFSEKDVEEIATSRELFDELDVSVSKCAAISYSNHTKDEPIEKHIQRTERLLKMRHLSPFEHQACSRLGEHANLKGWQSYRNFKETHND